MPVFFWPLLAGGVGYVGGLFSKNTLSGAVRLLILVMVALYLFEQWGKR